jgi:hypothetical protein
MNKNLLNIVSAIVAIVCFLMIPGSIIINEIWHKNNPVNAYVLAVSGEQINTVQHKHNATLESRYWIQIRSVDTRLTGSFYVENPFVADSYRQLIGTGPNILPNDVSIRQAVAHKNPYIGWLVGTFVLIVIISFIVFIWSV